MADLLTSNHAHRRAREDTSLGVSFPGLERLGLLWTAAEELIGAGRDSIASFCELVSHITRQHAHLLLGPAGEEGRAIHGSMPVRFGAHTYGTLVIEQDPATAPSTALSPGEVQQLARLCGTLLHLIEQHAVLSGIHIPEPWPKVEPLTPRQHEILLLMARGCAIEDISVALHVAVGTVHKHQERIYAKLHVHARHEAIAVAHRLGLIQLIHA